MVIFARNVPSEAGLNCPLCEKKYKVRTTKKHVKDIHSKSLIYKCVYPLAGGEVCKYSCGKRISCFINHQRRTHNLKFEEMAAHRYDITTHFVVEAVEVSEDIHSSECLRETKVFNDETMRVARKKYNEKLKASKPATDEDKSETPAPESERNSKRKAEDDTLAKDVKKARKEEEVKNTHAESTLPQSENVDGSTHAEESADDKEVIPEDTGIDEDFHEEFNAQQGELSDSEDDGEEEAPATDSTAPEFSQEEAAPASGKSEPKSFQEEETPENDDLGTEQTISEDDKWEQYYDRYNFIDDSDDEDEERRPEPALRRSGVGKFSRELSVMVRIISEDMGEANMKFWDDRSGWKKFVRKLSLCWHPDKNLPEFKRKSEEITKWIFKEKEKFELMNLS
jgi:hypothetical protein